MGGCCFKISYHSLYQNVTEGTFTFVDGRESPEEKRKIQPMHFERGLYPSIVDIVVAMNDQNWKTYRRTKI